MAHPGVKVPPSRAPKATGMDPGTKLIQSTGSKTVKESYNQYTAADIGKAPPSRVYTRDYSKVGRAKGDVDLVTVALGNPLGL